MSKAFDENLLRREIEGLGVEEILGLCYYAKDGKPERLRLYMDELHRRGGERAQFASCLLCFDLARQGDASCQREFPFLADTMRQISVHADLVSSLISEDPYLSFIWELCSEQLSELDPRLDPQHHAEAEAEEVTTFDLLSDDDFADAPDFGFDIDAEQMRARLDQAVDHFLGKIDGMPMYDPDAGFRLDHRHDGERVETFMRELDSLRDLVPLARGMRALVMLFYGTRLRSKNLFGGKNDRKEDLLRGGIAEFLASAEPMAEAAGVLNVSHASSTVWPKIADVLLDFVHVAGRTTLPSEALIGQYDAVGRLAVRDGLRRKRH